MEKKKDRTIIYLAIALLSISAFFLYCYQLTHIVFFEHLAAIPIEILVGAFLVEKFLDKKAHQEKLQQLMYIKSYLFRTEMRNLYISNFNALIEPKITMTKIKNASLDELIEMKESSKKSIKYASLKNLEPIIMEYVAARQVFYNFMEWAINNDFEAIFKNMIFLLHFIQDVRLYKKNNPNRLFVEEAMRKTDLGQKVKRILADGIIMFLDYAIELKEKQPKVFYELLSDYELSTEIHNL
jgi:hypothetical protein